MAKATVTDKDNGFQAIFKALGTNAVLSVGIHAAEGSEDNDGLSVAEIGIIHEFGAPSVGIPSRSFLRAWYDEATVENQALFRKAMQAVVKRRVPSIEVALEQVGLRFVGDIQRRISAGIEPELKAATIARKGSSTPLIDTGTLRSSITHKVSDK